MQILGKKLRNARNYENQDYSNLHYFLASVEMGIFTLASRSWNYRFSIAKSWNFPPFITGNFKALWNIGISVILVLFTQHPSVCVGECSIEDNSCLNPN